MIKKILLILIAITTYSFAPAQGKYVLVIHGGAGNIEKTKMSEEVQKNTKQLCTRHCPSVIRF